MSTLITGATGFIGMKLARQLADGGEVVHALCRATADTSSLQHKNIILFPGDVTDAASVRRAIAGCTNVYHLAAYARNWAVDPGTFNNVNVGGLQNIIDVARAGGVKKIVFTSTVMTLPPSNGKVSDESMAPVEHPLTDYARSKVIAESIATCAVDEGMPIVIVQPTRVFGPGLMMESNSATIMIRQYLRGTWRLLLGDGHSVGNWVHVNDVVRGHMLAMQHGRPGERYVLGGDNASFRELFGMIAEISGRRRVMFTVPKPIAMTVARIEELRASYTTHYPKITPEWTEVFLLDWAVSTAKAQRELGYTSTPLRDALKDTINWIEDFDREKSAA